MEGGEREAPTGPRVGALTAVGTMALVALVVCGGLVIWIRASAGAPAEADDPTNGFAETEVPTRLAGGLDPGEVPAAIQAAVDGPVLGALRLDDGVDLPQGVDLSGCVGQDAFDGEPAVVDGTVTPDGLMVILEGPGRGGFADMPVPAPAPAPGPSPSPAVSSVPGTGPSEPRMRAVCDFQWTEGGGWVGSGGSMGPADDRGFGGGGMGSFCCDADGMTIAATWVTPPTDAAWGLQDRGAYWVAYPVDELDLVSVSWRYRERRFAPTPPTTHIQWVDEDGGFLAEENLGF